MKWYTRSCERPRKRSLSEALPSSVSNRYCLSMRTHGNSWRRRARSSLRRVSSFSSLSSSSRSVSHSSRVPVLCFVIAPLPGVVRSAVSRRLPCSTCQRGPQNRSFRARRKHIQSGCRRGADISAGTRLMIEGRTRDLAMFNLAIDSKLRGCDVLGLKVDDMAPHGYTVDRATVRQSKTGRPVKFELTEQTRQAVDDYLRDPNRKPGEFLFTHSGRIGRCLGTRQYARLVSEWIASIGLDAKQFGTHSLRRTKATLIYRRTGNLRAVQLLLGHTKIESMVKYLGIE